VTVKRFNWQIWAGLLLSLFAFLSYPTLFVQWPLTRDFPWANILLFVIAIILIYVGVRRAFETGRSMFAKVAAVLFTTVSVLTVAVFVFMAFVMARWLPASAAAPTVGAKAPEFTLKDTNERSVSLTELLSTQNGAGKTRGVLLIFYRGYW
jgi:hypothetical protein